ncbi:MAG: (Fe-S)-binding protein [Saprospiraceae bacterium]|nr:(Fe-S)-binding protein [Saprospiraceae bacterium]MBK7811919.1 (Fe-S)-binding protein [Saprospiraceae bacterium]MBK9631924.1 (Fe-S)-binding protein [Saprospiraceae bacterium]
MPIKTAAEYLSQGESFEVLFWVGCAGSYDARAQKVSRAFAEILNKAEIKFAILGDEEKCTGDPARRAGNEFLFQILALQNIETLNQYQVKKIVCTCPHCFNTIANEYPELGGKYEVMHHSKFLEELISLGKIKIKEDHSTESVTYHDSCYLGRANGIYEAPRKVIDHLKLDIKEMKRSRQNGLCCGAGGAQMFKEDEKGNKRINEERIEDAIETQSNIVVANCPFCMTMLQDGIKAHEKQEQMMVYDLSEMVLQKMI